MKYYIGSSNRISKKKKIGKVLLYVIAYSAAFAVAFFISYKLVSGTQSKSQQEIVALREEVDALYTQLADKEERVEALQMQVSALKGELEEAQKQYDVVYDEPVTEESEQ